MDESKFSWNFLFFFFFFLSSLPLCNSIAIFSMEGSSPKNVCVLELWFLENSEQNRVVSDNKNRCMFLWILVTLSELYWSIHSKRQEVFVREVLHLRFSSMEISYHAASLCCDEFFLNYFLCFISCAQGSCLTKQIISGFGRIGPAWSTCWTTASFCLCLCFLCEKQRLCLLRILAGCWV